jgi:4-oxalocrotonate tautomerase
MPDVIVKLWSGKSDAQKRALSDAITKDVMSILNYGDEAVSVGFEEIASDEWSARVYRLDIQDKWNILTKEPGYGPVPKLAA